jgi:hypothetical protein
MKSLAEGTKGKTMMYAGPFSRLDLKLDENMRPKKGFEPINETDYHAYEHDVSYQKAYDNYKANPTPQNKKEQMKKVYEADDKFINDMKRDANNEPMASVAGKLIQTKKALEKAHILPTKVFEGFGEEEENNDPTFRLKQLALKQTKLLNKPSSKKRKMKIQKSQDGGLLPLAPILVGAIGALAGKVLGDIYSKIKDKITGNGFDMGNYKTDAQKSQQMKKLIKHITTEEIFNRMKNGRIPPFPILEDYIKK